MDPAHPRVVLRQWLTGLDQAVRDRRGDIPRLCRSAGIDPAALEQPNATVPLRSAVAFMEAAAVEVGDADLGLRHGAEFSPTQLGLWTYVVLTAATIGQALENLCRFKNLVVAEAQIALLIDRDEAMLSYRLPALGGEGCRQDSELAISIATRLIRTMIGDEWSPLRVQFEHPAPASRESHSRILGCEVSFDQPTNALSLEREMLARQVATADPDLLAILEPQGERQIEELGDDDRLIASARQAISRALRRGEATVGNVSRELGIGPRTLQRRLGEREQSFAALVDEVRHTLATRYLSDRRTSLTEIAFLLGYSDASAFSRAFRRWTGSSPSGFQRRPQAG